MVFDNDILRKLWARQSGMQKGDGKRKDGSAKRREKRKAGKDVKECFTINLPSMCITWMTWKEILSSEICSVRDKEHQNSAQFFFTKMFIF